ncbi:sugar transferase [Alkalihalobacillus trypoxylicola]|uniref:Sugar transferase n=1 Tax=Alkalihalobacillus trypoxylicola TaxID=519424 RepID=A0A161P9D8_9BACI|nr:sugar transferase [Alkalihalobacillus trypoxylicola]KYG27660.1 sugar transferase [Alkalihalobacillus trypoxylicola]
MKRIIDILAASILLIILAPLIGCIMLLIKFKLGSPVFFKQLRPGLNAKPFTLYKLRTMTNEKDRSGFYLTDSKRLTPIGRFLRKYSLDEWPQLINVLKGELSLVGPRPLLMEYIPLYSEAQLKRHDVKPGITGWAQVNGRNSTTWEKRFEYDLWYVENHSFLLDIKILAMTVKKVFRSEGINQSEQDTMERFKGIQAKVSGGQE